MKVIYSTDYNIDLGPLNFLHPFDGLKFRKVYDACRTVPGITFVGANGPVDAGTIDRFVGALLGRLIKGKRYILQALELPYIRLLPYSVLDRRILSPMRWGVSGTIEAARVALSEGICWNLAGGYHHASRDAAEGFCIYNDIGIAYDVFVKDGALDPSERVLIVDVDAHHGNGNAHVFMDNQNVVLLDAFNEDIYPVSSFTRDRVDIPVRLKSQTTGVEYLSKLDMALGQLEDDFRLVFVIAGTDVLGTDPLGKLALSVDDCTERDVRIATALRQLSVPAVFVGGGGYGRESAAAIVASLSRLAKA